MSMKISKRELFSKHALSAGLGFGAMALSAQPGYAFYKLPFQGDRRPHASDDA
jgi:hypothetical protein